jgi:biotin carboxylase
MIERHVVFVDSTLAGLLAFKTAKDLGCRVTFVEPQDSSFLAISTKDRDRITPHLVHVDQHLVLPTVADGRLLGALRQIAGAHAIDALITTSEAAILPVAQAAQTLGLPAPDAEALQNAVFKDRCRQKLAEAGLRSPRHQVLSERDVLLDRARVIHAPLVVKPTRGFGKQFSAVCKTEAEFSAFVATLDAARKQSDPMINLIVNNNYILEEYVTGSLHSAEVIVKDGEVRCFATTTRYRSQHNDLLEMGYSMPSGLEGHKLVKLEQYVRDVFKCLALDFGLYHVEILYGDEGPCLVEINGRMMGGVGPQVYQALSDRDAFELLLRVYLAEDVAVDPDALRGSATVVLIGAKHEGVVPENFMQEKLDALLHRYGISFCTLKLTPGMQLPRFESNLSVLGHVIVHGADPHSSALKGDEFLRELDLVLGVELAKYIEEPSKPPMQALRAS